MRGPMRRVVAMWHDRSEVEDLVFMDPRFRGDDSGYAARSNCCLMATLAEPLQQRRTIGDLLPAAMLAVVILSSVAILAHLGVVLWLAWTSGSPGDPDLSYTASNFIEVYSD